MDRLLLYTVGKLRFVWGLSSRLIEVYEMQGETVIRRTGMLTTESLDGDGVVEFEQDAFQAHCDRFLEMASTAEIVDD